MSWTIKEKTDYLHMIWKNGKGKSVQMHIEPENMTLEDPFKWRISSATITIAGAFSQFDGYNRTLIILKGNKLTLYHRQQPNSSVNLDHFTPYTFKGCWETDSTFQISPPPQPILPISILNHSYSSTGSLLSTNSNSNASSGDNSPSITSSQSSLLLSASTNSASAYPIFLPQVEETVDFNVISKENEFDHSCRVHSFNNENRELTITLDTSNTPSGTTFIFYPYQTTITVKSKGEEGSYQKCKVLSENLLIIRDIHLKPQQTKQLYITCKDNETLKNANLVVIQISPKSIRLQEK
ncbi:hypothetical protein DLAC_11332 [Tieghemostelium lacteum]|uniref:Uncharacterized protein n=1 Tax=Tieghemostelium lacteum TaxID=361077 RepID=A0A151Z3P7_TIELA|nr:hypothetical protein DLAC_11332 [Tieghemostelium lacteum]|eukprot:KYQ88593.1 hypothetical protein DLAC_11332 [Tieghemostelium lacteum]